MYIRSTMSTMTLMTRHPLLRAALVALCLWCPALEGQEKELGTASSRAAPSPQAPAADTGGAQTPTAPSAIPKRFLEWLREVDPIITLDERLAFLRLRKDYQRDAFIRRFWQVRDPYTKTGRNELRERWEERLDVVNGQLGGMEDDRSRIYLVHGPPARSVEVRCTTTRKPAEIWLYNGSEVLSHRFFLLFIRGRGGLGPARLWRPNSGAVLENVLDNARHCINGHLLGDVLSFIRRDEQSYEITLASVLAKPKPRSEEWIHTFAAYSTDLPNQAETLEADLVIDYLGRHQSRTVTQMILQVPATAAGIADFAGFRSYNFVVVGEVIRDDQLFESFRYKFGLPVEDEPSPRTIPLAFQRYLRPGDYTVAVRLQDLNTSRYFRVERFLTIPALDREIDLPPPTDPETARLFAEATASVATAGTAIRIVPPRGELLTGYTRFDTLATGEEIVSVAFYLDNRPVLTKNRPPYNVELDLGPFPHLRSLRVEAQDAGGQTVAEDEVMLNAGGSRFRVRLVEPRRNSTYRDSLRARADVDVPDKATLERVEFFLNEALVATLYQPPFAQPISLPDQDTISYVRAVAHLTDGNTTEDLVFINAPDNLEEIEVQFVEIYAAVVDNNGRPINDLKQRHFSISEDGVRQNIARFNRVEDLPIHVGVLIDNSASMHGSLEQTRKAALSFLEQAVTPRDRAAVITFNRFPSVAVGLTNDLTQLGGGLAGLTAEGQTALYDSLMFALYYFTGTRGQRAILLLSDGKDEVSRFSFAETLEYARRAGVTVYSIGLRISEAGARRKLTQIAAETGGQSYFLDDISELRSIYQSIENELRSQYFIAYQSTNTTTDNKFRAVDLEVDRTGVTVKTMSGYYP